MPLLREREKQQLRHMFENLTGPVTLVMFTQDKDCDYCKETRELTEEVAAQSDKITAEIYDFTANKDKADAYNIDKVPAIVILGNKDYGIRYYGIPSGYEFTSLIDDILMVSLGQSSLTEDTKKALTELKQPVHIQVLMTPT
jgi:glutaredoxin-like protein